MIDSFVLPFIGDSFPSRGGLYVLKIIALAFISIIPFLTGSRSKTSAAQGWIWKAIFIILGYLMFAGAVIYICIHIGASI